MSLTGSPPYDVVGVRCCRCACCVQLECQKNDKCIINCISSNKPRSTVGLVGYDAALTRLRSWVRFPYGILFTFAVHGGTDQIFENLK